MIIQDPGWCQFFITDSAFGHVDVNDPTFEERFLKHFQMKPKRYIWQEQEHTKHIEWVKNDSLTIFPHTDGLITQEPEVLLIAKTADCVPILLWNEKAQTVAVLHCGWKGFFAGIIEAFEGAGFSAFLGPHLRVTSFECQGDFVRQIPKDKEQYLMRSSGRIFYDLTRGVTECLLKKGISVRDCEIDTYNNPEYFSYRSWKNLSEATRPKTYSTFASCIYLK